MKVSVVIPTYNRPFLLARVLASLAEQTYDHTNFEVIVVDDGNSGDTKNIVSFWKKYFRVSYVPLSEHKGPAYARNTGWKAAKGQVIAFTDDDCIPHTDWLRYGVAAFHKNTVCVKGYVIVPHHNPPTDYEQNIAHLETAEFVTANCFCKKSVLQKLGGFDERFKTAWREDSDLQFRLLSNNYDIGFAEKAVVIHPVRTEKWGVSIREQKKTMYNALLYKKHKKLFRKKIQPYPNWNYYAIVGSFFATLICVGLLQWTFAVIFGGVWVMLTWQFIEMRLRSTTHSLNHVLEMIITSFAIPFLSLYWKWYGSIKYRVFFL